MDENLNITKSKKKILNIRILSIFVVIILISYFLFSAPSNNNDVVIHIANGDTLSTVSKELINKGAVRSNFTLKVFTKLLRTNRGIIKGDYLIKKDSPVWIVAWQISRGHHNIDPIKVMLKEGITEKEIIKVLSDKIPGFDTQEFINDPRVKEGYLFPDTYFFYPLSTTDEIITDINTNFQKRIKSVDKDIKQSGKSLSDIIIMASVLEKEASGKNDINVISGILWKRVDLGMLLQVDAAPSTYKESGLPKVPISNPGLLAIKAATNPQDSPYLFYLHDNDGNVHYATNFNEHRSNIVKYLK